MFETLRTRIGPLPGWAWGVLALVGALVYMKYRASQQSQQAATAAAGSGSTTTTVPVSNLNTSAQPMPIQLGDTFVNTGQGGGVNTTGGNPATTVIGQVDGMQSSLNAPTTAPVSPAVNTSNIC